MRVGTTEWTSPISTAENPFTGKFDGRGCTVKTSVGRPDAAKSTAHGLFGVLEPGHRPEPHGRRQGRRSPSGEPPEPARPCSRCGGVRHGIGDSKNVTNNVSISFEAEDPAGVLVMLAGIAGQMTGTTIGGTSAAATCVNNGDITTGPIANTANGRDGHAGGRHLRLHQIGGEQSYRATAPTTDG